MNTSSNTDVLRALQAALPAEQCLTDSAECLVYGYDNSKRQGPVLAVCLPRTHEDVVAIVKTCHDYNTPLVCRGRGTGTPGGSVPVLPSIVLSTEHMQTVFPVDIGNRSVRAQTGATNQSIQEAAQNAGFFWAPDPGSAAFCSLGGNLGNNAAGPRAVKYGTTRENTLQLKAVTGSGETLVTGTLTSKGVVGYDLTRLLIGSEGTLGIITEATLLLIPTPEAKRTMRAFYRDMNHATQAVTELMQQSTRPCALEFVDSSALQLIRTHMNTVYVPDSAQAMLMIEVDGPLSAIDDMLNTLKNTAQNEGLVSMDVAEDYFSAQQLWQVRKALSPTLRHVAPKKINEDVVVPVANLPKLVSAIETFAKQYQLNIVSFGHAGNGNLHVNILIDPEDAQQVDAADQCLKNLFATVLKLDGTLSGEHGVGLDKRDFVADELSPIALDLMRGIKQQFDPRNILNPEKIFP